MYIDDCVKGIDMIMHCDDLIATPINLGSSEMVSINTLLSKIEKIAGVKMKRNYDLNAPQGVAGRNSDNTFIKKMLKWEPNTTLDKGLAATYKWIKEQYDEAQSRPTRRRGLKNPVAFIRRQWCAAIGRGVAQTQLNAVERPVETRNG